MKYFDNTSLKDIYPETPDDIKDMIKKTVDEQIQITKPKKSHRYIKVAGICAGVVFAVSGTAYAAKLLSELNVEKVGNYGAEISVSTTTDTDAEIEVPEIAFEFKNLPEGYAANGYQCQYSGDNFDHPVYNESKILITDEAFSYDKYASMYIFSLPDGYENFKVLDTYVASTENFELPNGYGVYLEFSAEGIVKWNFSSKMYLLYPELNHMIELISYDINKEDMFAIAQSIDITKASEKPDNFYTVTTELRKDDVPYCVYTENFASDNVSLNNIESAREQSETYGVIDKAEFKKSVHRIGEELRFSQRIAYNNKPYKDENGMFGIRVTDVSVSDQNPDGTKVLPETLNYIRYGDGIDSANEIVKTETIDMKFVLVTLDITNYSGGTLSNYCLNTGILLRAKEDGDTLRLYDHNSSPEDGIDIISGVNYNDTGSPAYIFNGVDLKEKNNIFNFSEGDTRTVNIGFYVAEDELSDMYLELIWATEDNLSFGYIKDSDGNYSSPALENGGFFDIRQ